MRFATLRLLSIAAAAVLLAGCIDYEQNIKLKDDGSGSFSLHYWVKDNMLTQWTDGAALFREDSVRTRFSAPGAKLESVAFSERKEDSTKHANLVVQFDSLPALERMHGLDEATFRLERRGDTMVFIHTVRQKSTSDGMGMESYTASYAVELPAAPVASNGHRVEGRRVSWKYTLWDFKSDRVLTASWLASESLKPILPLPVILAAAGLVVLLIVVLVVRSMKKKPTAAAPPAEPVEPPAEPPAEPPVQ
jgi:hypothetical protein